jgi:uncharacterized protein
MRDLKRKRVLDAANPMSQGQGRPFPLCGAQPPMANPRAWVRLLSGKRLDLLNPTPFDWEDKDLALGLARTYRWGGHSAWPLPLSVAQHSLLVLALHRQRHKGAANAPAELRELLHDADEGLLGFDCIAVVKPFLGEAYRLLTERLANAIALRYRLPPWTSVDRKAHRQADWIAAASEAVHVVGWTQSEVRNTLRIRYQALSTDPLCAIYGCKAWEPWAPPVATERFLVELKRLVSPQS